MQQHLVYTFSVWILCDLEIMNDKVHTLASQKPDNHAATSVITDLMGDVGLAANKAPVIHGELICLDNSHEKHSF